MWFLNPAMLGGLAALTAPILIHLWQRRRVVTMPFSSLRFLKKVAARSSRLSKLENLLLLLLRCLIFALLLLAAAKPVMNARAAKLFGGNAPRTVILVVDNSASMSFRAGERTHLETAKAQAAQIAADLKPGDRLALITASDRAGLLIAEPTVDRPVVQRTVESIAQTQARSDFSPALREACKIATRAQAQRGVCQIFLLTDNQQTAWQFDPASVFDDAWRAAKIDLVVVRPDDVPAANAGITRVKWDTPFAGNGITVHGHVTIENSSAAPLHDVLEISVNGQRAGQRTVDVPARDTADVPVEWTGGAFAGGERWAAGEVRLSGDNYALDDRFFFTLPVYEPPRVLVAGGPRTGPERYQSTFFLGKALAFGGGESGGGGTNPQPPQIVSADELETLDLGPFTAVFLADPGRVSDRAVVRIDRWLETGGTVVFFPGDLTMAAGLGKLDFLPAEAAGTRELPAGRLSTAIADPNHPLFANAWDAGAPFPALPQRLAVNWKPAKNAKVLATIAENIPLIIAGERGPGSVFIVNASADRSWGDLPLSPAFLPLVQQFKRISAVHFGRSAEFMTGDPVPMLAGLPREAAMTVSLPDGNRLELPAGEKPGLLDRAEIAGTYRVAAGKDVAAFSVNVDSRESNFLPIAPEALGKMVPHEMVSGSEELRAWLEHSRGFVPVWPYLLAAALLIFFSEGLLANLTAAHRAQGDGVQIRTGRLNRRRANSAFRAEEAGTNAGATA